MRFLKYMTLLLAAVFLAGCASTGQSQTKVELIQSETRSSSGPQARDLKILTTSRHLADMIQALTEPNHAVEYMAESEEQLKSIAPDPAMMEELEYDAFFYIGAGYEPFIREFTEALNKNRIYVGNVSRGIDIKRHQVNKLDIENYYYLTNSTNYKIGLNSIKNALTELDPARRSLYNENFGKLSKEIDDMQAEIRSFMEGHSEVLFIADSDLVSYAVREYGRSFMTMTQFTEVMAKQANNGTQSSGTVSAASTGAPFSAMETGESRVFLYSEDASIQKYSEDIIRYGLLPVKIHLYHEDLTLMDSFYSTFREVRKVIETRNP